MSKIFFGLCLMFVFGLGAQTNCTIQYSGIVLDEHDNSPVPYAKVQIKGSNIGVLADSLGVFRITGLCAGTYEFSCQHHVGCKPLKFTKNLQQSESDTLFIEYHLQELEEATVLMNVFDMGSIATVKPNELERNLGMGKSLGEIVKQIPGVSSLNTGSSISKPVIHGMHSNRVVLLNHEIRQEGQQWGSEHAPEIDPFLSTELTLIKGAAAIRYGSDAIAGVITAAPSPLADVQGVKGKIQGAAFSNGRSGSISAMLEGRFSKLPRFSWRVQGSAKQGGTVQTARYYLKNTAMQERNFSWNAAYTFRKWSIETFYSQFNTDLGIFSGAHIGNLSDLNAAFAAYEPKERGSFTNQINRPNQHIEHELFKVKNQYAFSKNHKISLLYGRQFNLRQEYDKHFSYFDSIADLNLPSFTLSLTTHQADLKYEHRWSTNLSGEWGLSFQHQKNTYSGRFFIPFFSKNAYGIYFLESWKKDKYEIEVGLRADRSDLQVYLNEDKEVKQYNHVFQNANASLGYSRLFGHHLQLRANVSNAWRAPQVNELYSNGLHHGAAAIEVGNRNLGIEMAYNGQVGLTYKSNRLTVQLDAYHSQFDGYIYLRPSLPPQLTIKGAFPAFAYEQIRARFSGVDFLLQYKASKKIQAQVKGAIVRAFNLTDKQFIVGIPADRIEPGILYKSELKKDRTISFAAFAPLVAKQNRVDPGSDYVTAPGAYYLLNVNATYGFRWKKQRVELLVEINNVFNRAYRDYLNRFRYYADEMGRNIGLKMIVPFNLKN